MVYDDQETVAAKANYVKANKLGGMMLWSIDTDDFRGGCYDQAYPLLYSINKVLGFPAGGDRR
jgi:chitinase